MSARYRAESVDAMKSFVLADRDGTPTGLAIPSGMA
jgi:hypothetical protein